MTRRHTLFAVLAVSLISLVGCLETEEYGGSGSGGGAAFMTSYDGPHAYVDVTGQNFKDVVLNSDKPVMVDFWATWCGPCKAIAPSVAYLSNEYEGKVVIAKIDVDQAQDIASQYGISAIPTLVFFKDGQEVNRFNPTSMGQIEDALAKLTSGN